MIAGKSIYALSVSYGNDSMAMIQWAAEVNLALFGEVVCVYCDTGWASPKWEERITQGEEFARSHGFGTVRCDSIGFTELARIKKGFPSNQFQYCSAHLKGIPFLQWADEYDKNNEMVVLIGKRREESAKRADTPEFVEASDYHSGRTLWHPLYMHNESERDALLARGGFAPLPHRSLECNPCVNANRGDFLNLSGDEIARVSALEVKIGRPMFRPKRFNAVGIYGVVAWAKFGKNHEEEVEDGGCGAPFGCGI
jgi:3'-phosphoadenosine 5'-phosphosulfate sulfotransferase (PAPS reductase)/FAD synthetase